MKRTRQLRGSTFSSRRNKVRVITAGRKRKRDVRPVPEKKDDLFIGGNGVCFFHVHANRCVIRYKWLSNVEATFKLQTVLQSAYAFVVCACMETNVSLRL